MREDDVMVEGPEGAVAVATEHEVDESLTVDDVPARTAVLQHLPLRELHESPLNPRKHFDRAELEDLRDSIRSNGILSPLLARPRAAGGVEIAAGHRRYRAAKLVDDREIIAPVVVREMTDEEFLLVLIVENNQRKDVHPLEEAHGYRALMEHTVGYDIKRVAGKIGRSVDYVYDRLRLLQLVPAAQDLFLADRFTLKHAILIARLSEQDQARVIEPEGPLFVGDGGGELFAGEHEQMSEQQDRDPYIGMRPRSVRELQGWINDHIRFRFDAADTGDLFPETADAVTAAVEAELKVVEITHDYHIQDDARVEGRRVFGPRSWQRADSNDGAPECEHAVLGVVVVGPDRGRSFPVCLDKKRCSVHWAAEVKAAAAREKAKRNGNASSSAAVDRAEARARREEEQRRARRAEEEAVRVRYKKAKGALLEAFAARVKKLPAKADGALAAIVERGCNFWGARDKTVPRGNSAEDFVRFLAWQHITADLRNEWRAAENAAALGKQLGVDVAAVLNDAAPVPEVGATPATTGTPANKPKNKPKKKKAARKR